MNISTHLPDDTARTIKAQDQVREHICTIDELHRSKREQFHAAMESEAKLLSRIQELANAVVESTTAQVQLAKRSLEAEQNLIKEREDHARTRIAQMEAESALANEKEEHGNTLSMLDAAKASALSESAELAKIKASRWFKLAGFLKLL